LELDNAREPVAFIMERLPLTAAAVQCLLLSNNGQIVAVPRMSALCQKRTHAPLYPREIGAHQSVAFFRRSNVMVDSILTAYQEALKEWGRNLMTKR